ncbi:hypothetical protein V493_01059, partial [Pseudogymnoascus sp. VKM F-4281 (FW-2241)]
RLSATQEVVVCCSAKGGTPTVQRRGPVVEVGYARTRYGDCDVWVRTPHETRTAPLVFVSAKAARTKAFRAYAYRLAAIGDLGQIVLDEAYFTVTASEYCAAMVDLALIRGVRTHRAERGAAENVASLPRPAAHRRYVWGYSAALCTQLTPAAHRRYVCP